jgi:hypothetical protein
MYRDVAGDLGSQHKGVVSPRDVSGHVGSGRNTQQCILLLLSVNDDGSIVKQGNDEELKSRVIDGVRYEAQQRDLR